MPPAAFLTLPLELRIQIYTLLMPPLTHNCQGTLICERSCQLEHQLIPSEICGQITDEIRSLYFARHHVHVEIYQGRMTCLIPRNFPGSKVPMWQEVKDLRLDEWRDKEKERYPDFLMGCRNVLVQERDYFHEYSDVESVALFLKRFLPTLENAERVKIQLTRWRKMKTGGMTSSLDAAVEAVGESAFEKTFVDMMGLDGMPRLQDYCVVDKFSSVMVSQGASWGVEQERSDLWHSMVPVYYAF